MRKLMILFMALLLPLSVINIRADEEDAVMKIPLTMESSKKLNRSINDYCVESYFYITMSSIQTSVFADLGEIEVYVTNCSTGEMWYDTFDSGLETQNILQISGSSGLYEVTYITFSGDVYQGSFIIE